jgi:hypothetical protein
VRAPFNRLLWPDLPASAGGASPSPRPSGRPGERSAAPSTVPRTVREPRRASPRPSTGQGILLRAGASFSGPGHHSPGDTCTVAQPSNDPPEVVPRTRTRASLPSPGTGAPSGNRAALRPAHRWARASASTKPLRDAFQNGRVIVARQLTGIGLMTVVGQRPLACPVEDILGDAQV